MIRYTLTISDDLDAWLTEQAALNHRSKNKQIEHVLSIARKMAFFNYEFATNEMRYITQSSRMCHNGQHHFIKPDPATNEFCNCGVFIFGEVVR